MKYAILPALALAGFAHAAPFTGEGVPASTGAVLHLDLEVAGQSDLVKTLREIGEAAAVAKSGAGAKAGALEQFKTELGIDDKSVRDMTVAVLPGAAGAEPSIVFRARGAFSRAKFEALSKKHPELTVHQAGKHTWYSLADMNKVFEGKGGNDKGCVCMTDDSTVIVVTDEPLLATALAAAEGKSAYAPDAVAKPLFAAKPMLAGYFPESFIKAMKPAAPAAPGAKKSSEVKSVVFTLNDAAGQLALHADTKFDSPAGARETQSQAAMMSGMFGMMMAQEKPDETAAQKQDKAFAVAALQAVKFAANGDTFTTDFVFPTDQLVAKLNEKRADILAGIAQQANASAAKPPVARRVKKKPAVVQPVE